MLTGLYHSFSIFESITGELISISLKNRRTRSFASITVAYLSHISQKNVIPQKLQGFEHSILKARLANPESTVAASNYRVRSFKCTVLCLYFPGILRQVFKHVPKCRWIPLTKFPWIPRTNMCSVIFMGKTV